MRRSVRAVLTAGLTVGLAGAPAFTATAAVHAATVAPTSYSRTVSTAGATVQWRSVSLQIPARALPRRSRITIRSIAAGDYALSTTTALQRAATLHFPTSGQTPMLARRSGGLLSLQPISVQGRMASLTVHYLGEFTSIPGCSSKARGRALVQCLIGAGVREVPRSLASRLAGPDLSDPMTCGSGTSLDLFSWTAVCSMPKLVASPLPSDSVQLVHITDAPGLASGALVLHADGSIQQVDDTCVARITNRNVPTINLTTDGISTAPRSSEDLCAPLYGPPETTCPAGTTPDPGVGGVPPVTCSGTDRAARWITAATGGKLDFGSYSLAVGPGVLTRDCYVQTRILSAVTRLIEDDTDCAFNGVVTVTVPVGLLTDAAFASSDPLSLLHLYDDNSVIPESIKPTADGRVSAQLKNLSPVLPGKDRKSKDSSCQSVVLGELTPEAQALLAERANVWANAVCGQLSLATPVGLGAQSSVAGGNYDNVTRDPSRGFGPETAAYYCGTSAALAQMLASTSSTSTFATKLLTATDDGNSLQWQHIRDEDYAIGEAVGLGHGSVQDALSDCVARAEGGSSSATLQLLVDGGETDSYSYHVSPKCPCYVAPPPPPPPPPPPVYQPPPPPQPSVGLTKGGSAQGQRNCSSYLCAFEVVSLYNFGGGSHFVQCFDSGGRYAYYNTSSATSAVCYYGFHATIYVTVDGVRSNDAAW